MRAKLKIAAFVGSGVFWPITAFTQADLTGQITHVRDGDTIAVGNIEIRLNGLTCDERGTDLGDGATVYIRSKALGKQAQQRLLRM